jgi:hypothetical protein
MARWPCLRVSMAWAASTSSMPTPCRDSRPSSFSKLISRGEYESLSEGAEGWGPIPPKRRARKGKSVGSGEFVVDIKPGEELCISLGSSEATGLR